MSLEIKTGREFDVIGMGSALLDFIFEVSDDVLADLGLKKGEMHLIDEEMSSKILTALKGHPMQVAPGGSSANTLSGVADFGGRAVFIGTVGSDENGKTYENETAKTGVTPLVGKYESITGHAITFITPDSERTFATHLGAALNLSKDDVAEEYIKKSKILHFEGYLFEAPHILEACIKAMEIARSNGVLISIDLSDPALIGRIHDTFDSVIEKYCNIIFVNEDEALAYTGKEEEAALKELLKITDVAVVKLGDRGSLIGGDDRIIKIPVYPAKLENTNGAGDMYAAGVLFGFARGYDLEKAGRFGSYAASLVVASPVARHNESIDPVLID